MALPQRPASRFFAAFYRWSRHTQQPSPCALPSQCHRLPRNLRPYHASRRLLNSSQSAHELAQGLRRVAATGTEDSQATDRPLLTPQDPSHLKEDVRSLMRMVPASVAVITVAHIDPETNESVPMGIAVSSLSTVTLDPPTVSFNIKQPSKTLNAIRDAPESFRIHFVASTVDGLRIIEHFCQGNHTAAYEERLSDLSIHVSQPENGSAAKGVVAPRIQNTAVRAALECRLTQELSVADHVILVAQIKSIETGDLNVPTIAYVDGSYRRLDDGHGLLMRHKNEQVTE